MMTTKEINQKAKAKERRMLQYRSLKSGRRLAEFLCPFYSMFLIFLLFCLEGVSTLTFIADDTASNQPALIERQIKHAFHFQLRHLHSSSLEQILINLKNDNARGGYKEVGKSKELLQGQ